MSFELTVLHAFGKYAKGAAVWIAEEVEAILGGEHANHVVKVPAGTHAAAAAADAGKAVVEGAEAVAAVAADGAVQAAEAVISAAGDHA